MKLRVFVFLATAMAAAAAGDSFYLGTWKISAAVVAPWVKGKAHDDDTAEMKSLIGKTIVIKPRQIAGPKIVTCFQPNYRVAEFPASMLFQGAFEEMQRNDKTVEPDKLAAKLGFRGERWRTLETGCSNELDYHFLDEATAEFALNNYIYTIKKQ